MDVTLTDVDGISDATKRRLTDNGFESVEDVASSQPSELAEIKGFGPERATEVVTNATELLTESEMATTDTQDLDTTTVSYEVPGSVAFFVIQGLIMESVRLDARNKVSERNRAYDLTNRVIETYVESETVHGDDETVDVELEVTMDDLNIFQRSVSSIATDYHQMSGITNAYGHLRNLRESIDDDRSDNWGL